VPISVYVSGEILNVPAAPSIGGKVPAVPAALEFPNVAIVS
jgi:hypothetical protein